MTKASEFFDMSAAPMRVGKVLLKVRDLEAVSGFYRNVLGLTVMATDGHGATLGTGNTPLVVLKADAALAPRDRRQPGLFHTAFLMARRVDLARWLGHVAEVACRFRARPTTSLVRQSISPIPEATASRFMPTEQSRAGMARMVIST